MITQQLHKYVYNTIGRAPFRISAVAVMMAFLTECAVAANSVTQYGITWTFSKDQTVGQFVNGDWWVIGPVTLTNIDPKTDSTIDYSNGSMLNPIPGVTQGLYRNGTDTSAENSPKYTAAKNISLQLPLTVQPNNSIYSTMDNPETWVSVTPNVPPEKVWFKETAVLTVLSAAPPVGSFRPPYAGTNKTIKSNWNVSRMNYAVLRSLAAPVAANVPSLPWMIEATKRPLLEMQYSYVNSNWKATWAESKTGGYPRRTYGREIAHISSGAGLYLQTNVSNATKERLLINMCQWGIDVFGLLNAGMQWQPNGGHQHGRLLPLYIAAKVLGDNEMLAKCTATPFQEFDQHWFVTQADVDMPRNKPTTAPYSVDMIGMPEWFAGGAWERQNASSDWNATAYRFICGAPTCGTIATILLMGGRAEINSEPLFQYIITRYYPITSGSASHTLPSYGDNPTLFTRDMWDTYISGTLPPPPVVPPTVDPPVITFSVGDRIATTRDTNVRDTGSLSGALLGKQIQGSLGTIVAGPVVADNITWWQVNYDNGSDGWSGGDNFIKSTTPSTAPTAPTGLKIVN